VSCSSSLPCAVILPYSIIVIIIISVAAALVGEISPNFSQVLIATATTT